MSQAPQYPEEIPQDVAPLHRFTISTAGLEQAQKDVDLRLDAYSERIEKIIRTFTVKTPQGQDYEIIRAILHHCRDRKELKGIAKGLDRAADIITEYDELESRSKILKLVHDDPSFLAWALGDFESELDSDLEKLLEPPT